MGKHDNIFKPSKSKGRVWNFTKTIMQSSLFWLVFLFLLPWGIIEIESLVGIKGFTEMSILGWILFSIFGLFSFFSAYAMSWLGRGTPLPMDCANILVISGPYRIVRNPLAVAGIGQGVCVGLIMGSFSVIIYSLIGAFIWHFTVRPIEEKKKKKKPRREVW